MEEIAIIGVNEAGFESANEQMCEGRDLPWLQEEEGDGVWDAWGVVYRDLVVVGGDGDWRFTTNLTRFDLADEENLDLLKDALLAEEP